MKPKLKILIAAALLCNAVLTACNSNYGYEFENGYNVPSLLDTGSISVDTSMFRVDRSMYHKARIFPGLVPTTEPRLMDVAVEIDLNYVAVSYRNLRMSVIPQPMFSTGLYAAPGELIIIDVPQEAVGLSVQIGIHTDNLSGKSPLRRDPLIYTVKALRPGRNYVRNLYGGGVYIRATRPLGFKATLKISGAVKSPDFILGETTDEEFMENVKNSSVPWLELRSDRIIFTLPRAKFLVNPLENPTEVMEEWDKVWEKDFNEWMGLSDNATNPRHKSPQLPWRIIQDIQPSAGYAHSGYPVVALNDFGWFNEFTTLEQITNGGNWGAFHEIGHNCQQTGIWSWAGMGETTNNLFAFKVAERNGIRIPGHPALDGAFEEGLAFAASAEGDKDFNTLQSPFTKLLPFVQIFEKYGYGVMTKFYTEAREADHFALNDLDRTDFVYRCVSEYTGINFAPFFDAWGIQTSPQMQEEISAQFPLLTKDVWAYDPRTDTGGDNTVSVDIPRTTWIIADKSSEEATGEGSTNGRAAVVLDGDASTYWHSQWAGGAASPPHYITIDMGANEFVSGLYFIQRGSRNVKDIEILVSSDNSTWQSMGTFVLEDNTNKQRINFTETLETRYLKVVMNNSWDGTQFSSMAEIGAYIGEYQP